MTNEDLFCLNESEFLNDVIIDFYLKYIYVEKLAAWQRERTHVFSSCFYRRLTLKEHKRNDDPNITSVSPTPPRARELPSPKLANVLFFVLLRRNDNLACSFTGKYMVIVECCKCMDMLCNVMTF